MPQLISSLDTVLVMTGPPGSLVGCRWWLWLEGFIPPPVGAFAGWPGVGRDSRWGLRRGTRQRSGAEPSAGAVGDDELVCGSADGDDAPMVQPVMVGADQHQVGQLGEPAVFPMPKVMGV